MANGKQNYSPQWWLLDKTEVYKSIFCEVDKLFRDQGGRTERNLRCARLYGSQDFVGAPYNVGRTVTPTLPEDRVKVNIISSMADTVSSKLSKMKPTVTFLTEGGSFHLGEQSKLMSKYVRGLFQMNNIWQMHQRGFLDSTVFDCGAIKHFIEDGRIVSERTLGVELLVNDMDAIYGNPRSLYQYKLIHKEVLKKQYPKKASSIAMSSPWLDSWSARDEAQKDYVLVIEAWHLPTSDDSDDGRHVICTDKDILVDEDYKRSYFPFTFFKWTNRLTGFWGQSLAERLVGTQLEINKLLRLIQKAFHLGAAFKVFLEHGSKVAKEHLNNDLGSIIYYTGQKPEFYAPKVVNEEVFRHLQFLIESAYQEAGVSQMSASSVKPTGIDSGKALREYNEVESERFAVVSQNYEATFLCTARQYVDLSRELYLNHEVDTHVSAESKKFLEKIKWSDIDLEHDQYQMQMFPTSMLPHTPAGRLQWIQELINEQFIPREYGMKLLDFPDIDAYTAIANAPLDNLLDTLDDIIYKGKYSPPEPYQDLVQGVKLFQAVYLKSKRDQLPDARLEMMRDWINNAEVMLQSVAASQQQIQGAQQGIGPTPNPGMAQPPGPGVEALPTSGGLPPPGPAPEAFPPPPPSNGAGPPPA